MDRKTQEILFNNSVDLDMITERVNKVMDNIQEVGNPKKLIIELRKKNEFGDNVSMDDVLNQIDDEYSNNNLGIDLLRLSKVNDYYVIIGVRLD